MKASELSSSVYVRCAAEPAALNGALVCNGALDAPSLSGSALLGRLVIGLARSLWRWRERDGAVVGKPIL